MMYAIFRDDRIEAILCGVVTAKTAVPLPDDFRGVVGMHRDEFRDDWSLRPLSERVAAGHVQAPRGYRLDGETWVEMTQVEKYRQGVDPIPDGMILEGDDIRPMTRTERVAAGLLTQEKADELDRLDRIAAARSRLAELDAAAVRPLRAVVAGTATDADHTRLTEIEAEAQKLREALAKEG